MKKDAPKKGYYDAVADAVHNRRRDMLIKRFARLDRDAADAAAKKQSEKKATKKRAV